MRVSLTVLRAKITLMQVPARFVAKQGKTDLDWLHLAVSRNGCFDEKDIGSSPLGRMGTGAILDHLASMIERGLLKSSGGGRFCITDGTRESLWSNSVPLWVRILRVLDMTPLTLSGMAAYLGEPAETVSRDAERLRREGMVVMVPVRDGHGILRTFEILPGGSEELGRLGTGPFPETRHGGSTAQQLLANVEEIVRGLAIDEAVRSDVISKLEQVRAKIGE